MRLTTTGTPVGLDFDVVGRVTTRPLPDAPARADHILATADAPEAWGDLTGYRAVITTAPAGAFPPGRPDAAVPRLHAAHHVDHLRDGDVVGMQPGTGFTRTLYRPDSHDNTLFVTERCNSNCLMCSQPPRDRDDIGHFLATNLELIRLMAPGPAQVGITGGEPTLLGDGLFQMLGALRDQLPQTQVHMLTNGRRFAWREFTRRFAEVRHPNLVVAIPLYADAAAVHDYVVQARDAFDQAVLGLHALARWKVRIEVRVVLHRVTIPRLVHLAEYIARNLPFVEHVALMGLEPIGYMRKNREALWIDPADYQDELEAAVEALAIRGLTVSIYNHQLCVLRRSLWKFAVKSISDWKNIFLDECGRCGALDRCGGLFHSAEMIHSRLIRAQPSEDKPQHSVTEVH